MYSIYILKRMIQGREEESAKGAVTAKGGLLMSAVDIQASKAAFQKVELKKPRCL
jgi:hypothetical protein